MDAVAALLDGSRVRDAFLLRATMAPPWALRIDDQAPLTVLSVVRGSAWVTPPAGTAVELHPGDVALVPWTGPYEVADPVGTAPTAVILPDGRCQTLGGEPLDQSLSHGLRTWGNDPLGGDVMVVGTYTHRGEVGDRLLGALPPLAIVRAAAFDTPLLAVLEHELERDAMGQGAVLDRLLDLVLATALRAWFGGPDADPPAWYLAMADPVVGDALQLLHDEPGRRWTVASLAAEVGVSRAALARRFTALVGEPPMGYLTTWRLTLAADRLRDPQTSVASVAAEVGYANPFAFSTAFKRHHGISPRRHALAG
jgi:AraC-like DNA-binding protein